MDAQSKSGTSRGIFADNAQRAPRAQPQPKFLHQKDECDAAVSLKGKLSGAEAIEKFCV